MKASGHLHVPAALPPGKYPRYPLNRRLVGAQSRSGRGGEENKALPLPGIEPRLSSPHPSLPPELPRLVTQLSVLNNV